LEDATNRGEVVGGEVGEPSCVQIAQPGGEQGWLKFAVDAERRR
jgi:hypothetical protein